MVKLGRTGTPPTCASAARPCTAVSLGSSRSGLRWQRGAGRVFVRARANRAWQLSQKNGEGVTLLPPPAATSTRTHTLNHRHASYNMGQPSRLEGAPRSGAGGELGGRARWRHAGACLVGPIAVLCTPQHTPYRQGGQGGLMREEWLH